LPGTPMWHALIQQGRITENDYFEKDKLVFFNGRKRAYRKEFASLRPFFEIW
jgi:hypothetical protein